MKNIIIKYWVLSSFAFLMMGCAGELDIDPSVNEVIQPDFSNLDDVENALYGVYSSFKSDRLFGANLLALGEWSADDLKISSTNVGFGALIHEWDYTESDATVEATWVGVYDAVRRANFVIAAIDQYAGEEMDRASRYRAEALVLRSLALLEGHKLYGQRWIDGSEMSMVFVTNPNDITLQAPRISSNELFAQLTMDLQLALNDLADEFNDNFVSKSLAHGLLARIALYQRNWNEAVTHSTNAITSTPVNLSNLNNYDDMWGENDESGEAIFKLALDPDDPNIGDNYYNDGVGPVFDPSNDILSLYATNDIRRQNFFRNLAPYGLIISKFFGPASQRGFHEPFIMRLSEMYLIRAEANAELGNDAAAVSDLDAIRSNRLSNYSSIGETGDVLRQAIKIERRKELAYEGFRFTDLRRWGLPITRTDCTSDECVLEADDFKFSYPIPRAELFANDNVIQNPGY